MSVLLSLESQIKYLKFLLWHEYTHGDVCDTHLCVTDHASLQAMRRTLLLVW